MRSYDDQSVLFQRAQVGTDTKLQRFVIALQWFIHENKRCVECQSAGKRYAFLLSVTELIGKAIGQIFNLQGFEKFVDRGICFGLVRERGHGQSDVLPNRQMIQQLRFLEKTCDALRSVDDGSCYGFETIVEKSEKGGLSGS